MDSYLRDVLRIAVCQLASAVGFISASQSSLDALVEIAHAYLTDLGKSAASSAALSQRPAADMSDALNALKRNNCDLGDLMIWYLQSDRVPFAKELPAFPVPRPAVAYHPQMLPGVDDRPDLSSSSTSSTAAASASSSAAAALSLSSSPAHLHPPSSLSSVHGQPSRPAHIPFHLPPFPPARSFRHTALFPSNASLPSVDESASQMSIHQQKHIRALAIRKRKLEQNAKAQRAVEKIRQTAMEQMQGMQAKDERKETWGAMGRQTTPNTATATTTAAMPHSLPHDGRNASGRLILAGAASSGGSAVNGITMRPSHPLSTHSVSIGSASSSSSSSSSSSTIVSLSLLKDAHKAKKRKADNNNDISIDS